MLSGDSLKLGRVPSQLLFPYGLLQRVRNCSFHACSQRHQRTENKVKSSIIQGGYSKRKSIVPIANRDCRIVYAGSSFLTLGESQSKPGRRSNQKVLEVMKHALISLAAACVLLEKFIISLGVDANL